MSNIEMMKDQELEMISGGTEPIAQLSVAEIRFGEGTRFVTIPNAAVDLTGKTGVLNALNNVIANTGGLANLGAYLNGVRL